jgi:hypothetical protein
MKVFCGVTDCLSLFKWFSGVSLSCLKKLVIDQPALNAIVYIFILKAKRANGEADLAGFYIFIIRIVLGAVFALILSRFFYPDAGLHYVIGLGVLLVGLAYGAEYFRIRRTKK